MKQIEIEQISLKNTYFSIIESLLFVSGEPLKVKEIANIIECSVKFTKDLLLEMMEKYEDDSRGIKLININDKYQLVSKPENSTYVQKILKINERQSLSQASLETLAIIAYKQPVTRVEIEDIRGVKSDSALVTLAEKGLIKEAGRKDMPGRPIIYATTDNFLAHFQLKSLDELPTLDDMVEGKDKKLKNKEIEE